MCLVGQPFADFNFAEHLETETWRFFVARPVIFGSIHFRNVHEFHFVQSSCPRSGNGTTSPDCNAWKACFISVEHLSQVRSFSRSRFSLLAGFSFAFSAIAISLVLVSRVFAGDSRGV